MKLSKMENFKLYVHLYQGTNMGINRSHRHPSVHGVPVRSQLCPPQEDSNMESRFARLRIKIYLQLHLEMQYN